MAGARRDLAACDRDIKRLIQAIKGGVSGPSIKDELDALEARKAALTSALAEAPLPAMHPQMAQVFRQKATTLAAGFGEHDDQRDAARQAQRGFLDKIVIPPGDGLLQVVGDVGMMLAAAPGRSQSRSIAVGDVGCGGGMPSIPTALYVVAA